MGSDSEPVVEDVSADDAKAAMQRQATQQAQVKSIINSIDIEGPDLFHRIGNRLLHFPWPTMISRLRVINSNNPMKALKRAKIAKALEMQKEADKLPSLTPEVKWAQTKLPRRARTRSQRTRSRINSSSSSTRGSHTQGSKTDVT